MTVVGKVEVLGQGLEINVNSHGMFSLKLDGKTVSNADTLEKARDKARVELKKQKVTVEVPFISAAGEQGVATSFHATTGDILCTLNGRKDKLHFNTKVFNPDTPSQIIEQYQQHQRAIRNSKDAVALIERDHQIRLHSEVGRAIEAAVDSETA